MAAFSRLKSNLDLVTGPRGAGSYYREIVFRAIFRRGVRFLFVISFSNAFPPVSSYNGSCTISLNIAKFNILGSN